VTVRENGGFVTRTRVRLGLVSHTSQRRAATAKLERPQRLWPRTRPAPKRSDRTRAILVPHGGRVALTMAVALERVTGANKSHGQVRETSYAKYVKNAVMTSKCHGSLNMPTQRTPSGTRRTPVTAPSLQGRVAHGAC
jgi:hypothetical protein